MIQFLTAKLAEITTFIKSLVGVYAIVAIAMTWWKTRAWIPTLTSMLVAGTVMWGISNVSWFQDKVAQETSGLGRLPVVVGAAAPAGTPRVVGLEVTSHGFVS